MDKEISLKIKKFWHSELASDGGIGKLWKQVVSAQREASVSFAGSSATRNPYKNVLGGTLATSKVKGDKTINFQLADWTPEVVAAFTGGSVTTSAEGVKYEAPLNENQTIEKSLMFLSDENVLFIISRADVDAYEMVDDSDLHFLQVECIQLTPEKEGLSGNMHWILADPTAKLIKSFVLTEQTGSATINNTAHTVAITVAHGTDVTALEPVIEASLGADVTPNSGDAQDFTNPVNYVVEAADGSKQTWVVTVTVAP